MFIRNLRFISNENRLRFVSLTKCCYSSLEQRLPSLNKTESDHVKCMETNRLPSYLPAPTGVQSKIFDQFYLIFRLGFHQPLRFIQLVKLTQTLATALVTPYRIYMYSEGLISFYELQLSILFLSAASISLFVFGWAATRTICYIYTTVECDRVILTHIDFWGRRRNVEMETKDIIPINDIETPNRIILPFKRYSIGSTMYYSLKLGQILDRPRLNRIFAGLITQDTKNWW